jgi:DNA-directed RNA polymerase specialized sigma24 family protein
MEGKARSKTRGESMSDSVRAPAAAGDTHPTTSGVFGRVDERSLWVRSAMHSLPDLTDRSILVLRFFVGLSLDEIAGRLFLTQEDALTRYRRVLRILERELGAWL